MISFLAPFYVARTFECINTCALCETKMFER
uniref:Uncharacterized protein n=1 Tax=Arundo donax TaxID=35708 RepID=A0A0A9GFZ3_ARUDO